MKINPTPHQQIPVFAGESPLWSARSRSFFGLPLSFRKYTLYRDRLIFQHGMLVKRQDELRLYRILDVSLRQSILQRIFGLGSICLYTNDISTPKLFVHDVRRSSDLSRYISDLAESERERIRVTFVEGF